MKSKRITSAELKDPDKQGNHSKLIGKNTSDDPQHGSEKDRLAKEQAKKAKKG